MLGNGLLNFLECNILLLLGEFKEADELSGEHLDGFDNILRTSASLLTRVTKSDDGLGDLLTEVLV